MGKIALKEKMCYGFGDLACNTLFTLVSSYLMFFYTDVVGIGLGAVGVIMVISRVVDAVTDPIMGGIIDKTNTKWGKARPYILWMAIPFAVISVAMFMVPSGSASTKFIYALVTYVLFCIVYTALNIPYTTMLCNMTDSVPDRLGFNMFKTLGSSCGSFLATGVTLALVAMIGKSNQQKGFVGTVAIYGVVGCVLLVICFKNTKERIIPIQEKVALKDSLHAAFVNKPWILLCIMAFLNFTGLIIRNQGAMYYAKYYLGDQTLAATLMAVPSLIALPLALITPQIAMKIGKRNCILYGNLCLMASLFGVYAAGQNFTIVMIWIALGSIGFNLAMGVSFVMIAETVDYSEWKTGIRPQGLLTAVAGFMVKLGMAVAGAASAAVLSQGGYVENAVQTSKAIAAIKLNYIWLPMAIAGICAVVSLFYDLDKKYSTVIAELHARKKGE